MSEIASGIRIVLYREVIYGIISLTQRAAIIHGVFFSKWGGGDSFKFLTVSLRTPASPLDAFQGRENGLPFP